MFKTTLNFVDMSNREELENTYKNLANRLAELVKPTGEVVSNMDNISKVVSRVIKNLEIHNTWNQWHDIITQINNWDKLKLPQFILDDEYFINQEKAIIAISKFGWYINYSTIPRDIFEAEDLSTNETQLNDFMCKVINNDYDELKSRILNRHKERADPLIAAFKAHENADYYLSIPVFLSQIDGITHDALNKHFFKKPENVKKWAKQKENDGVSKVMFAALTEITIFQETYHPRDKSSISRHSILHGGNVSYGNQINSFKVLSLLFYLSDIISI